MRRDAEICGDIRRDAERCGEMRGDTVRCGEMRGDAAHLEEDHLDEHVHRLRREGVVPLHAERELRHRDERMPPVSKGARKGRSGVIWGDLGR